MTRLQNALTKQLTDEHERVDLQLREKVTVLSMINVCMIGRRSKKDKEEERRDWCVALRSLTLTCKDANNI